MLKEQEAYNHEIERLRQAKDPKNLRDNAPDNEKSPDKVSRKSQLSQYDTPIEKMPLAGLKKNKYEHEDQIPEEDKETSSKEISDADETSRSSKVTWNEIMGRGPNKVKFQKKSKQSKLKKAKTITSEDEGENLHPAAAYLNKPLKRPEEQRSFDERVEISLTGKDPKLRQKPALSKRQRRNLSKSSLAQSGEGQSQTLKKPPKYPSKPGKIINDNFLSNQKGHFKKTSNSQREIKT